MSLAESIANTLGGAKRTPEGYLCRCPCHEDKSASLSIKDTATGGVAVNCFAGCNWEDIKAALESQGLLKRKESNYANENKYANAIFYNYKDVNGKLLGRKVRLPGKKFWNERYTGEFSLGGTNPKNWQMGLSGLTLPLYNAKAVQEAEGFIYLCEGEKDADTVIAAGFVGTTNPNGASSWDPQYTEALRNKRVIICVDNDAPGRKRRDTLIATLTPVVTALSVFEPPGVPEHGDITDWVEAGGQVYDVPMLCRHVKVEEKQVARIKANEWINRPVIPAEPLLMEIFDTSDKVVIIGQSKTRKSFFAQQLGFCIAAGQSFLGFPALDRKRVLIIQSEIKEERYHARFARMSEKLGIIDHGDLEILNARGVANLQGLIEQHVKEFKPDVVIIDPFYKLVEGDENKSEDIKPILRFFDLLSEATGTTVIYIHHDKKGISGDQQTTDRGSGSGLLARDFDSAIYLSPHKDSNEGNDTIVVDFITRNYAPKQPITIEWNDFHFITSGAVPVKKTSRNSANGPRIMFDALYELARSLCRAKYLAGYREIGMGEFNSMLEDADIPARKLAGVKERLVREGVISIAAKRSVKGQSNKMVTLLEVVETSQNGHSRNQGMFDYGDSQGNDGSDIPF